MQRLLISRMPAVYSAPLRTGDLTPEPAIDPMTGQLYVVWQDSRFSGGGFDEVAISTSTDAGHTWTTPKRVNTSTGHPAFTPSVAVAEGGQIGISYYDLRNDVPADASRLMVTRWLATSSDRGTTFS